MFIFKGLSVFFNTGKIIQINKSKKRRIKKNEE